MKESGERIRYLRRQLRMTQKRFGEVLGLKPNTVATIESGLRNVSPRVLKSLELQFGVNPEWIIRGDGEPYKDGGKLTSVDAIMSETLSTLQLMCMKEIAGFNDAQMKKLTKALSCICENEDIKKLADRLPVDDFEAEIIRTAANKMNKM